MLSTTAFHVWILSNQNSSRLQVNLTAVRKILKKLFGCASLVVAPCSQQDFIKPAVAPWATLAPKICIVNVDS